MYLVTYNLKGTEQFTTEQCATLSNAKTLAEKRATAGLECVTIWLKLHTCQAETTIKWQDHAKSLTSGG